MVGQITMPIHNMGDQTSPRIEIGARKKDKQHIFFVSDNGVGVEPLYQEKIFGLFNKIDAENDGSGIGLALVKRIIEVHGGKVWVESEGVGRGSTFCFSMSYESILTPKRPTIYGSFVKHDGFRWKRYLRPSRSHPK